MSTQSPRPWWNPVRFSARRANLEKRSAIVAATRAFFSRNGFVEVETPALQVSPGMEPHLAAFATELEAPGRAARRKLYLHTSPEFAMKKLLVAGCTHIFQLARVFRNGERSDTHHPEFVMLEWYRAGDDYTVLMNDCATLLRESAAAAGASNFVWRGQSCDPRATPERITVVDAFRRFAGIDLAATMVDPRAPDAAALSRQAARTGVRTAAGDRWDDVFFRVFLERIEPHLGLGRPTIVDEYPISMAALARAKPKDRRFAERFELYVAGLELANGFGELTDASEQRRRFEADQALKARLSGERYPIDADFLDALAYGMPASAGIALGFDRLVMLATGAARIEQVIWTPVE